MLSHVYKTYPEPSSSLPSRHHSLPTEKETSDMLGISVKTDLHPRTWSGKWLKNRAQRMVGSVVSGPPSSSSCEESRSSESSPPPSSTPLHLQEQPLEGRHDSRDQDKQQQQQRGDQKNHSLTRVASHQLGQHHHPNRHDLRATESCPTPNISTDSGGGSSPTPSPEAGSLPNSISSRSRFSWRKKPLDLLKMVEGHFTLEDPEPASPWEMTDSPSPYPETPDIPLPDMIGSSEFLTDEHRKLLCQHLPARAEGYTWSLLYSTSKHGFSLKSLYREMAKVESPILMVIQDTQGSIFGSLTSCPIKTSDLFYGTGESFLFTFDPDFARFPWTGDNMYFIKGNADSLVIGAGDGMFGIWLDEDLCHGRSQPCNTFANPRLSKQEDFVVKALECWAFV